MTAVSNFCPPRGEGIASEKQELTQHSDFWRVELKEIDMTEPNAALESSKDIQAVDELHQTYKQITEKMGGVIVGQEEVIEQLLVALLCRGHCILEGVPGLAKTLMVSTLASLLDQTFRRIQFTPDLMPSDITG